MSTSLPRVVLERANAVYSMDFNFWLKWRASPQMNPHTAKVLEILVEKAETMIPVAVWKNMDPSFVWCGAFVNEHNSFYCGYRPVEQSEEDET